MRTASIGAPSSAGTQEQAQPVCVLTRIEFPNRLMMFPALRLFRRIHHNARTREEGLVLAHCWRTNSHTLTLVSLWTDLASMAQFAGLEEHVNAVRWTIRAKARAWSGVFDLRGTSYRTEDWITTRKPWMEELCAQNDRD